MTKIIPVLLAGGSGERLWPLSRKSYPKQFSRLIGETTLFQSSAKRLTSSEFIEFAPHVILTNSDFRFIIGEQLQEVGIDPGHILIEPEGKNTAAAILAASLFAHSKEENATLLVAPSDHIIPYEQDLHQAISVGLSYLKSGNIVTFGVKPTYPETGYGYLELSHEKLDENGTSPVLKFVEKPGHLVAKKMLEAGNFFWNVGIFLFNTRDMIEAFEIHAPEMLKLVSDAINLASEDLDFLRLGEVPWSKLEKISIDYAVMEKAKNIISVPYNSKWSDLGNWDSVWSESKKDKSGNVLSQGASVIDCFDSLIRSENTNQQIFGVGLESIIAVAMPDAVLVAHKNNAQDVRKVVDVLRAKAVPQAEVFPKDHRPWGWFESLAIGDRFQVKRICVKPGAALSLQSHMHRSEHWVVVKGTASVTIGKDTQLVTEGESIFVPLGELHRMENKGRLPMILIEIQIGSYLCEDDITRYQDNYRRS